MKAVFNILFILVFLLPASDAFALQTKGTISVGQQLRSYRIVLPTGQAPAGGYPLVLAFHGGGMQGAGMERISLMDRQAERYHFIVIYPDGIDKHWNDGRSTIRNPQDDVGFVSALLAQAEQRYPVNKTRIFATGISNGALFAERLGCELSSQISAIAPVAGTIPDALISHCHPAKPIAVLQIDGTADPIMPFNGGAVNDFHGLGEGGRVSSVAETDSFWAKNNHCSSVVRSEHLPPIARLDSTRVDRLVYENCPAKGLVEQLTIIGGGHVWPGGNQPFHPFITGRPSRQINASAAIAAFFMALPAR